MFKISSTSRKYKYIGINMKFRRLFDARLILLITFILIRASDSCDSQMRAIMKAHRICLGGLYPRTTIKRFEVPEAKISWDVDFPEYDPPVYTSDSLIGKPYADPDINTPGFNPSWHSLDNHVNRASYEGAYPIDDKGYPLNPRGRTGLRGHGHLGRWGPNHAADPIVTRWKRNNDGEIVNNTVTNRPILQLVVIQRRDNKEWALPGGMVDPGEKVSNTAVREFLEEATNSQQMTDDDKLKLDHSLKDFFSKGEEVTCSYVDDPRNTDNSWMETTAFSFHDETGDTLKYIALNAGDDAVGVKWVDLQRDIVLYATHKDFVEKVVHVKHCHW